MKPDEKIDLTKQSPILYLNKGGFSSFEALQPGSNNYIGTLVVNIN